MSVRPGLERGARTVAVCAVLGLLWLTWRQGGGGAERAPTIWRALPPDSVAAWTFLRQVATAPRRDTLRLHLDALPVPSVRAGLGTLSRGSVGVQWEDRTWARGLAASAQAAARVDGGWVLQVAAPPGTPLVVADAGSTLDSLTAPANGVMGWQLAAVDEAVTVRLPTAALQWLPKDEPPAVAPRVVRLVASPGWEAKFLTAALEEAGWRVDGALEIAPRAIVRIGAAVPATLTPRTVAAVIVLDSAAADVAALTQYVRRGGGLLLAGEAAALARWRAVVPGQVGALEPGLAGALVSDRPRLGLAAVALRPASDAVLLAVDTLGVRTVRPLVAARRLGEGRVVVSALHETWRWRMEGRDDGAAAHRRWWLDLVESVSARESSGARDRDRPSDWPGAQAPYADLVARIGPPIQSSASPGRSNDAAAGSVVTSSGLDWRFPLFLLALVALLVEWSSRRLRGER